MATRIQIKVAIVVALIAAALVGRPVSPLWLTLSVIAFGAFNVFLDASGTAWIRALAIAGTIGALVLPNWFFGPVALLAWLVWVPAFAVAWALARDSRHDPGCDSTFDVPISGGPGRSRGCEATRLMPDAGGHGHIPSVGGWSQGITSCRRRWSIRSTAHD
jgi:hypothetical protein